jgi:hypothetical protein
LTENRINSKKREDGDGPERHGNLEHWAKERVEEVRQEARDKVEVETYENV